jgi:thiol-disulfide isomerase/thioredoxin
MIKNFICLIIFCACLRSYSNAQWQPSLSPKIGDTIPNLIFENIINAKYKKATISNYLGKPIILDFWATWCGSCVQTLPKIYKLEKEVNGQVQFLLISSERESILKSFFKRFNQFDSTKFSIVSDTSFSLGKLFNVRFLSHYVWIDKDGTIKAFTGTEYVTLENLRKLINQEPLDFAVKEDEQVVDINKKNPLLLDTSSSNYTKVKNYSVLTNYLKGVSVMVYRPIYGYFAGRRILITNSTIAGLYRVAYGDKYLFHDFPFSKTIIETKDSVKINPSISQWETVKIDNGYCYDLIIPTADSSILYKRFQTDLAFYFKYKIKVEKRKMNCLSLRLIRAPDFKTNGEKYEFDFSPSRVYIKNGTITNLIEALSEFLQKNGIAELVDDTRYNGKVTLEISSNLTDLKSVNLELAKYGLVLMGDVQQVEALIISD